MPSCCSFEDIMNLFKTSNKVKEMAAKCIEAPTLKGVSTTYFIDFKRRGKYYVKQFEEKRSQSEEQVGPNSNIASIEDEDLEIFSGTGWIRAAPVLKVAGLQPRQHIKGRSICKAN